MLQRKIGGFNGVLPQKKLHLISVSQQKYGILPDHFHEHRRRTGIKIHDGPINKETIQSNQKQWELSAQ